MSAFRDLPEHFVEWLRANVRADAATDSFPSRAQYGAYLQSTLAFAVRHARSKVTLDHLRAEAVRLSPRCDGFEIGTDSGTRMRADQVVLALGNPRSGFRIPTGKVEVTNGWSSAAVRGLARDATVLLIGSGLTAIDVCLALNESGHTGVIYAVSRRGMLPQVHARDPSRAVLRREDLPETSVRALMAEIRRLARRRQGTGEPWQRLIDGLRPLTQDIWRALPLEEKRRFLRHLRPFWEVHRHRMAPQVHNNHPSDDDARTVTGSRGEDRRRTFAQRQSEHERLAAR